MAFTKDVQRKMSSSIKREDMLIGAMRVPAQAIQRRIITSAESSMVTNATILKVVSQYVLARRVERARELLRGT